MIKKENISLFLILVLLCFLSFFTFLGSYPLLDVDETRYVTMARDMFNNKDFMTLYLNGEYFFEKPSFYFWLECLSFEFFGTINELTSRLPIVILSFLPLGLLFLLCKKVKNIKFAFIVCSILVTSLEYNIITKIAILDSVLTSFIASSILCYFYTFFVKEKNKKYFWFLTYIFSALAVMTKGIPGFIVPFGIILISTIVFKKYKELFMFLFPGLFLFLIITLPWHLIMLKTYPGVFFHEYIYKHHFLRFLGSDVIHRNQPWYFYFLTILWGAFPHIFIVSVKWLQSSFKNIRNYLNKKNISINTIDNYNKLKILNIISIMVILLFFSSSKTKLITYILPIYPFLAFVIANIWEKFILYNDKLIKKTLILLNIIFLFAIFILFFIGKVLPSEIYINFIPIQIISITLTIIFVIYCSWTLIKNKTFQTFLSIVLYISCLSAFLTPWIYYFDYSFGQNDLIKYAKLAKDNNFSISTYKTGKRYSLLYYSELPFINFQINDNLRWLNKELDKKNNLLIVRNKDINNINNNLPLKIKYKGVKFSVVERK